MHIHEIDLNLLRLFDAVYRTRNVSRAADLLEITQPAASQGLARLRALIHDPLFMRAAGGVQPTPRAQRLAQPVRQALSTLEQALGEAAGFDPRSSGRVFQLHMSDIGEGRFLPELMVALSEQAPGVRVETRPLPREQITEALDSGRIDFAVGFLPMVKDTQRTQLLKDRYVLLLRKGHPFTRRRTTGRALLQGLRELEFLAAHGAKLDAVNKLGWMPVTVADGVEYTPAVLKRYPEAAALLRQLMAEQGLRVPASTQPGR